MYLGELLYCEIDILKFFLIIIEFELGLLCYFLKKLFWIILLVSVTVVR